MAFAPHTPGATGCATPGTHRRGGDGRPEFRRLGAGFIPSAELLPAPITVDDPGPPGPIADLTGPIVSPGFSGIRLHVNVTNAGAGGQLSFTLIELDPATGAESVGLLATPLILDTGPMGVGAFDRGGNGANIQSGVIFSTWHWLIRVRQALGGGSTTINTAKVWLLRMF